VEDWNYTRFQALKIPRFPRFFEAKVNQSIHFLPTRKSDEPFLFKHAGLYYLCCAEMFDGRYSCAVSTAKNIYGPYGARYEAIPHGGHNTFFQDEKGRWWSTYFGPPWYQRASIVPVEFGPDGKIGPKSRNR
jgi:beta-xylosidase